MDRLLLEERIRTAIELRESHFREFKSSYHGPPGSKKPRQLREVMQDIARTLVAFANADGGELLVGVEDDGSITGIPYNATQIATLLQAPQTHVLSTTPLTILHAQSVALSEKTVLYFSTAQATRTKPAKVVAYNERTLRPFLFLPPFCKWRDRNNCLANMTAGSSMEQRPRT